MNDKDVYYRELLEYETDLVRVRLFSSVPVWRFHIITARHAYNHFVPWTTLYLKPEWRARALEMSHGLKFENRTHAQFRIRGPI